jgi:hypothetical protein
LIGAGTLKKGYKIWGAKSRVQKQGHCYSKREEAEVAPHILDPTFFQGHKPTHVFEMRIVGAD